VRITVAAVLAAVIALLLFSLATVPAQAKGGSNGPAAVAYTPTPANDELTPGGYTRDPGVADSGLVLVRPGVAPKKLTATEAAALPEPQRCKTTTVATSGSYSTTVTVCVFDSTGTFDYGTVVRFKCYKSGVLFGDGLGGCRWVWQQVFQRSIDGIHWETMRSDDNCYTCEGEFIADSLRWYGTQIYALWCGYDLRGATRAGAVQPYRVRFYKSDNTETLVNMKVALSLQKVVPC
jgi:hypothetical protein